MSAGKDGRRSDRIAAGVFWVLGMATVALLLFIIVEILARGLLTALNPKFFLGKPEAMKAGGGILPMIVSTLYLVVLTIAISLPISIGAAIYMSEFARRGRVSGSIRFCLDSLSTLPSIVFGLFGMTLFVIYFRWGMCLLAGACTLAILNLPILLRGTEEAIRLVPNTYREASMSLGASKWTTIRKVVLPTAMPGIMTATILPIGRIMGESAAIIYTTGLFVRNIPLNPLDTAAPLAGYIWYAQSEALVNDYRRIVDGGAALLLIMVLAVYFLARYLGKRYQQK
ncbi:MAG: phosphate ABC transporter permease PstA [Actinobacteria bacterium]|nr:phosphate ABC transporter permease PstA [Actinomycetota bacterium]MBU1945194.1 phosphate ABC transporter permease PstA [Actinomycetota bacterium]MBU2687732.1 phosphate ABC transporter permease PstA [Actinomycetota bacterium]